MTDTYAGKDPIDTPPVVADEGAWPDLLTVLTDNAPITAANFNASVKGLADRTVWLARRLVNGLEGGAYTGAIILSALEVTAELIVQGAMAIAGEYQYTTTKTRVRTVEGTPFNNPNATGTWIPAGDTGGTIVAAWVTTDTNFSHLRIPLRVPHGAHIVGITAYVKGAPGHGAFPANKPAVFPSLTLCKRTVDTGGVDVATQADTSATAGAYEAIHDITLDLSGSPEIVDRETTYYYLRLVSEGSTHAIAGMFYLGAVITYTCTALTE